MKEFLAFVFLLICSGFLNAAVITGQLVEEETGEPITTYGYVTLLRLTATGSYSIVSSKDTLSERRFVFRDIPAGEYALRFETAQNRYYWSLYKNTQDPNELTLIKVANKQKVDLGPIALKKASYQIDDLSIYPGHRITPAGGKLSVKGVFVNNTDSSEDMILWVMVEEFSGFATIFPIAPRTIASSGVYGAQRRITAKPGATSFTLPLEVPPLPKDKEFIVRVFAGHTKADVLAYPSAPTLLTVSESQ